MKKILHIFPMLHHYTVLLRMLLINFALAHRTHCKLFSILLALFSDLVAKVKTFMYGCIHGSDECNYTQLQSVFMCA